MEDIVQLTCPACGGSLNVSPNALVLTCQHCGTESFVRREGGSIMLESFARCPRCGRNDRAEKVSAIMSSQTQKISSSELQTRVVMNQYGQPVYQQVAVPKVLTQSSELAKKLKPPEKPKLYPQPVPRPLPNQNSNASLTYGIILLVIAFLGLIFTVIFFSTDSFGANVLLLCGLPTLLLGLAGVGLTILGITKAGAKKLKLQQDRQSVTQENKKVFENWKAANQQLISKWQIARKRWEDLYYCHRDDCVFIPEEGTCSPLGKIREYLEQEKPS